jgi:WD40 repeat protein
MHSVKLICVLFCCTLSSCSSSDTNNPATVPGKGVSEPEKTPRDFNVRKLPVDYENPTVPYAAAVSNDGKLAAVAWGGGGATSRVELWEADSAKLRWTFYGDYMGVAAVAFWLGDDTVLVAGAEGVIRFLDVNTGKVARSFKTNEYSLNRCALAPGGHFALTEGRDVPPDELEFPSIKLWDLKTGKLVREHQVLVRPGDKPALSSDGTLAVHGGLNSQPLVLTNLVNGEIIQIFEQGDNWGRSFAFVPSSRELVITKVATWPNRLVVLDTSAKGIDREIYLKGRSFGLMHGFRLTADQEKAQALVYYDSANKMSSDVMKLSWLDLKTSNEIKWRELDLGAVYDPPQKVQAGIRAFSDNGRTLFLLVSAGFQVWDLETGSLSWKWTMPR